MSSAVGVAVGIGARAVNRANQPVLLEEEIDKNHVPTEEELIECAEWLGMDVEVDADYMWIARQFMTAAMPKPWQAYRSPEGNEVFYFNSETFESTWNHPCDEYHRELFQAEKRKNAPVKVITVSCAAKRDGGVAATCTNMAGACLATVHCEEKQSFAGLRAMLAEQLCIEVRLVRLLLPNGIMPDDEELACSYVSHLEAIL